MMLIDGTNASDNANDRPGMRALAELSVRSPLRECGITKDEVRRLSKETGLFTWDKPAYACLAMGAPSLKNCCDAWNNRKILCLRLALAIFGGMLADLEKTTKIGGITHEPR